MTAQLPDKIVLQGQYCDLYSNPLEQYWKMLQKSRPAFCPLPHCTRGYVATWAICDDQLFLMDIDGNYLKKSFFVGTKMIRYTKYSLFPKFNGKGIKAEWYSGKLRIPQGKMTLYEHSDYNSRFEKDIIITIQKGELLKMVTLDYTSKSILVNMDVHVRRPVPEITRRKSVKTDR